MRIVRVDCSAASHLPLCPSCHWRGGLELTRADAMRAADRHAAQVHPGTRAALTAGDSRRRALVSA